MRIFPLIFLFLFSPFALAGGSLSFSEILPLLEEAPDLLESLRPLEIEEIGSGRRIGRDLAPALAGKRLPPYRFAARGRSGLAYSVTVNTDVDFFDADGKLVFRIVDGADGSDIGGLAGAVKFQERASSISIKALDPH